jgi:hypothetical protein
VSIGDEERGDVDTAETGQRRVESPCSTRSAQRAQNRPCMSQYVRGASDPDCPLETPPAEGDAGDFLGTTGKTRARPGGIPSPGIPTNRATQSRVGLGENKSWTCSLRVSGRCASLLSPTLVLPGSATWWGGRGRVATIDHKERVQSISICCGYWTNKTR